MKYMIMMFGSQATMEATQSREWIMQMIKFMHGVNDDLVKAGEFVVAEGLADATQAKTVTFQEGLPVVTDGPFSESKESLAGFWIIDVENEARALEFAMKIVAFTHGPIEVRQVPGGPPPEYV
jgi:hypothetical protein